MTTAIILFIVGVSAGYYIAKKFVIKEKPEATDFSCHPKADETFPYMGRNLDKITWTLIEAKHKKISNLYKWIKDAYEHPYQINEYLIEEHEKEIAKLSEEIQMLLSTFDAV